MPKTNRNQPFCLALAMHQNTPTRHPMGRHSKSKPTPAVSPPPDRNSRDLVLIDQFVFEPLFPIPTSFPGIEILQVATIRRTVC